MRLAFDIKLNFSFKQPDPPDIDPAQSATGAGDHYVYVHRDRSGRIFYVGKGVGRRAWSKDRDAVWHHYLQTRSGGDYTVQIVSYHATGEQAEHRESEYITKYGPQLTNWINPNRGDDLKMFELFHERRDANRLLFSQATQLEKSNLDSATTLHREVCERMYEYERLPKQNGLIFDLLAEIHGHRFSPDHHMLNRLTLCLAKKQQHAEVVSAVDECLRLFEMPFEHLSEPVKKRYLKCVSQLSRSCPQS